MTHDQYNSFNKKAAAAAGKAGGPGNGKWANDMFTQTNYDPDGQWKTYNIQPGYVSVSELLPAVWHAPKGWNKYSTGKIPGSKIIITKENRIKTREFEAINFVMV